MHYYNYYYKYVQLHTLATATVANGFNPFAISTSVNIILLLLVRQCPLAVIRGGERYVDRLYIFFKFILSLTQQHLSTNFRTL